MHPVESIIRQEILAHGSISFARFMELALYCPKIGYYERASDPVGRQGDFYTSVSAGPLFGELLACQFAVWLPNFGPKTLTVAEAGAHHGQLALDILTAWRRDCPGVPVQYWIVEPSPERQSRQRATLDVFAGQVSWFASLAELPEVSGVIVSNELLDAMPVHILRWRAGSWAECNVGLEGDRFVWREEALHTDIGQPVISPELATVLPDGFQIEVSPSAVTWWQAAARKLRAGKLLAFDYGGELEDLLAPHRSAGTVRAYYRHQLVADVLARPGEQDITAHVNFSAIKKAGEEAGLTTDTYTTQTKLFSELAPKFSEWTSERARQFQMLTHPEHLGRAFRVLVQSR